MRFESSKPHLDVLVYFFCIHKLSFSLKEPTSGKLLRCVTSAGRDWLVADTSRIVIILFESFLSSWQSYNGILHDKIEMHGSTPCLSISIVSMVRSWNTLSLRCACAAEGENVECCPIAGV